MTHASLRPPYDIELNAVITSFPPFPPMNDETFAAMRIGNAVGVSGVAQRAAELGVVIEDRTIAGPRGDLVIATLHPQNRTPGMPAIYAAHGGGMVFGDRFTVMTELDQIDWVAKYGIVIISADYRLAPENPAPAGVEDAYAGLLWTVEHAAELDIDPNRIVIYGCSGGGGIAAGVGLLARDKGGPTLLGQMLICPQLDDRNTTVSSRQFAAADGVVAAWPREYNEFAWDAILGTGHGDQDVSIYAAPARATDLSGLSSTYIDAGSAEVFRDESVAYASLLWEGGVQAELHIWGGGYHGFDIFAPTVPVSLTARATRDAWLRRIFSL